MPKPIEPVAADTYLQERIATVAAEEGVTGSASLWTLYYIDRVVNQGISHSYANALANGNSRPATDQQIIPDAIIRANVRRVIRDVGNAAPDVSTMRPSE